MSVQLAYKAVCFVKATDSVSQQERGHLDQDIDRRKPVSGSKIGKKDSIGCSGTDIKNQHS